MPTRRQEIATVLRAGPASVRSLAGRFGVPLKIVLADLEHLRRSLGGDERFEVLPAECLSCGYVFQDRRRLSAPSRCPSCRRENIAAPEVAIAPRE